MGLITKLHEFSLYCIVGLFSCAIACPAYASESVGMKENAYDQLRLLVASFGTIDSQAEVEGWLSDQLKPVQRMADMPKTSEVEIESQSNDQNSVSYVDWTERRRIVLQKDAEISAENARRARILTSLKTRMLSDSAQRYTQLGRDYLQASLYKKVGRLVKIVDRGNMTIQQTEKQIKGEDSSLIQGADCVLSVVLGDREESSKTIPIDNVGTLVKRIEYKLPYVGKIRDLSGNVLAAFNGEASYRSSKDNVVNSIDADPTRKLVEAVCEKIAEEVMAYFTVEIKFKIKVPDGVDADDAEIYIDENEIDGDTCRVLACDHRVRAILNGCSPILKNVSGVRQNGNKVVKLNFKSLKN